MWISIHLVATLLTLVVIFVVDEEAFLWITGKKELLDRRRTEAYHALTWAGLVALIVSGFFLLLPRLYLLTREPLFIIKLLFVGILITNAVLIGRLLPIASARSYASLTWKEKMPLFMSGATSTFAWAATIAVGFYLFL